MTCGLPTCRAAALLGESDSESTDGSRVPKRPRFGDGPQQQHRPQPQPPEAPEGLDGSESAPGPSQPQLPAGRQERSDGSGEQNGHTQQQESSESAPGPSLRGTGGVGGRRWEGLGLKLGRALRDSSAKGSVLQQLADVQACLSAGGRQAAAEAAGAASAVPTYLLGYRKATALWELARCVSMPAE